MRRHILCIGDSNTHGYCADPADCADRGNRFNEEERWTCLLQRALGEDYLVIEEGLSGRTTVFPDPLHESMDALPVLYALLMSHEPVDLLVLMLGTNDTKDRLGVNATCIGLGMERLVRKALSVECWGDHAPNVLIVSPPPIGRQMRDAAMGIHCAEKAEGLAQEYAALARRLGCHFLDAAGCELNSIDFTHLSRRGHAQLAQKLAALVPGLLP